MKSFCLVLQENLQNDFTWEILLFSCKTGTLPVITRKLAFIALEFVITKTSKTDLFYKFVLQFPVFFIALATGGGIVVRILANHSNESSLNPSLYFFLCSTKSQKERKAWTRSKSYEKFTRFLKIVLHEILK